MQWQLSLGRGLTSSLISWFGGGGYSHVDVITPKGLLRGARSDRIGHKPAGYWDRPLSYDDWVKITVFDLSCTPTQEKRYWEFSNAQMRKPYDSRGILGFVFGKRDWREDDSWFCSEEVCANAEYAEIFPTMYEHANRVDPGDIAFILCALGASWTTTEFITESAVGF